MGLDMFLRGEKYFWTDWENTENNPKEDGFKLKTKTLELGYWRKHPNLHGYIVEKFAKGEDNCEPVYLSVENIKQIIQAVKNKELPETTGFFFGESDGSEDEETIKIFESAIKWVEEKEKNVRKTITYTASW